MKVNGLISAENSFAIPIPCFSERNDVKSPVDWSMEESCLSYASNVVDSSSEVVYLSFSPGIKIKLRMLYIPLGIWFTVFDDDNHLCDKIKGVGKKQKVCRLWFQSAIKVCEIHVECERNTGPHLPNLLATSDLKV